jgi:uncharacterized protein YlxP (DUF503 family)
MTLHEIRSRLMIVGVCTVELFIPDGQSLKSKRQVLAGLKDRLRGKFNVSVAEVDGQDLWQKAVLGIACVANETAYVNQVLDQVLNQIRSVPAVEVVQSRIELL